MKESKFRYEKKFVIENYSFYEIEEFIKSHPGFFREIYQTRYINNIYLDCINFSAYHENISGDQNREKTRIRWYGEDINSIKNPQLELKIKRGLLGTKEIYELNDFNTETSLEEIINNNNLNARIVLKLKRQKPILINSYKRKYFQSYDKKFRITVDTNLNYYFLGLNHFNLTKKRTEYGKIIVELKYDSDYESESRYVSSNLPFRLSRNSKYLTGVHYMINT